MAAVALCLALIALTGGAVAFVKFFDQTYKDSQRKTYRLAFPAELDVDQVVAWLRSVSGIIRSSRIAGHPTIVFELWATSNGIVHRLKVPWQHADYVIGQLRSLVPGMRVSPEEDWPSAYWTKAVEVGLTHSAQQLAIPSPEALSASLLASVQALKEDETIIMQWVTTPILPKQAPEYYKAKRDFSMRSVFAGSEATRDEVADRREKLEDPNVMAVLRVGAQAPTPVRAEHLIHKVRASLGGARSAAVKWKKRMVTANDLQSRIEKATTPVSFPMQLSSRELASLIAWPLGSPLIAGMPPALGKQYPPNEGIPRSGIVVGTATFPGAERPLAIGYDEALMHTWVGGSTGTGKSALLANMARQIMEDGYGLIVIETAGNLYQSVLDYIPQDRLNDVVLLDVADHEHPVGFNILDQGHPHAVIDQIINLFNHKYQSMWAEEYLYHGLRTIAATPGLSFTDLPALLAPKGDEVEWVDYVTRNVHDPELVRWWQRQDNMSRAELQKRAAPVLSRIWQMASRPELRYIMGQSESTFKIDDVLANGKILLVNLKGVGKQTASLAGTLIMNAVAHATKTVYKDKPTYIVLDEFADYMDLPLDMESMLAQFRKDKVGLVLANQYLTQLRTEMRDGIMTNARSKVVLTTNAEDGRSLAREMGQGLEIVDFTSLEKFEGIAHLLTPMGNNRPVSMRTIAPKSASGYARAAVSASRSRYARDRKMVVEDIEHRHQVPESKRRGRRPSIGSAD